MSEANLPARSVRQPVINEGVVKALAPNCAEYHEAVTKYGLGSREALAIREQHAADASFFEYAKGLDSLMRFAALAQRPSAVAIPAAKMPWCEPGGVLGQMQRPITEDWLRTHGFAIQSGRVDEREPLRRLAIGSDTIEGRVPFGSSDDLCIDIAPCDRESTAEQRRWYCWIMQLEPYRHIHVRRMRWTHEIARLWEGLTGRVWPGTL